MNRCSKITNHLQPSPVAGGRTHQKHPDDVVIICPIRTATCKARRGAFKDTQIEDMLLPLFKEVVKKSGVDPSAIGDIVVGSVLPKASQTNTQVRIASLLAGIPRHVPCQIVSRQCSSGSQAIASVAASIKAGFYDIGLAGGVENMSLERMGWGAGISQEALAHPEAQGCYLPMGTTSENVAKRWGISRERQDQFALASQQKALHAQETGRFDDEIVPVQVKVKDKDGEEKEVTITKDEGVRANTTLAGLGKLKPAFAADGCSTAGNSSQVSDGASVCLLARRSIAERMNLPIMATFRGHAVVGVEPAVMGIGPAVAIPAALKNAGLSLQDIGLFEINEAFASQAVYCVDKLGIPMEKVNVNGGAIALGHALGCTGNRLTVTLLHEMKKRNVRYGIVSMCIGSGMGLASVFELEQ